MARQLLGVMRLQRLSDLERKKIRIAPNIHRTLTSGTSVSIWTSSPTSAPVLTDVLSEDMVVRGHLVSANTVTISPEGVKNK